MFLIISCSLKSESRSRILANTAKHNLEAAGEKVELIDLVDFSLPFCDAESCYGDANAQKLSGLIKDAEGILLASPVYNYDMNAAAKNVIELTGQNWKDKVIGFLCAAGGYGSYMSVMSMANSLMLDFRCLILPKFVYATGEAFRGDEISDSNIVERLEELTQSLVKISRAANSLKEEE